MSPVGRKSHLQERIEEADRMVGIYAKSVDEKFVELHEMISVLCIAGAEALRDLDNELEGLDVDSEHRLNFAPSLRGAIRSAIERGFYKPREGKE